MDDQLIDWLLQSDMPSIRYFTLRDLLDTPSTDKALRAAQKDIMQVGIVPEILARQNPDGSWENPGNYYSPKYTATHWSLMLLTLLGVDGTDARFQRGVDFMFAHTRQRIADQANGDNPGIVCFAGNVVLYAAHAGRLDDPHMQHYLAAVHREAFANMWQCQINWNLACAWGAARVLYGLAAIPPQQRPDTAAEVIASGLDFLLDAFQPEKANYPTGGDIHSLWHKLNFPLYYQADILTVLNIAAELDALDRPGAEKALDWLRGLRLKNGHWRGSNPYKSRSWLKYMNSGETDRWVSLIAARILKKTGAA